ncbi:MAG: bifunctional fucokinase/fucose-1-phosphate guanylyltransferase, partial [Muribaculaceae bacterium]|nr:bifunctional fucokinase/fucose-1-phosphate guanylyltransferase [Muribaculaceae bacterium]
IHAGGQSRRLPAYAVTSKALTPVPIFRWALGQSVAQTLLTLQMPLYEQIMHKAPRGLNTLIASGDVYIHTDRPAPAPPQGADVVCYGLWTDASQATHHGVFALDRRTPFELDFMLQKPTVEQLAALSESHYFLMDIGLWLLSDRAMDLLSRRSTAPDGTIGYYDLYSHFGCALGCHPSAPRPDAEISALTVAILPLEGGEFYHFGTSAELISSTLALQSKVADQRQILHHRIKPHPALFTQNSSMGYRLTAANSHVWVENSHIPSTWSLSSHHVITGIPRNRWHITLPAGVCLDMVPIGSGGAYAIRPYGMTDAMRGALAHPSTTWMGQPVAEWFSRRGIPLPTRGADDIQQAPLYPVTDSMDTAEKLIQWMTAPDPSAADTSMAQTWQQLPRLSADDITAQASLTRLTAQRQEFMAENLRQMAANYEKSVFYQLDLADLTPRMAALSVPAPEPLPESAPAMTRMRSHMLRSRLLNEEAAAQHEQQQAFDILRGTILGSAAAQPATPRMGVMPDQIVWARSPLRIDIAGGWTDTPPYSLCSGGSVVNIAVELNGQPPLQTFIKPCPEPHIVLRSIDMGASEVITDYATLTAYRTVGSPFSIPKAALTLAGFAPGYSSRAYPSLRSQLRELGCGIEITLLSAVPAGSGLGTSSILASTVLGALSDFCSLGWDSHEICRRTLALEQLLTTGGGWQDQYGGVLPGVKLLQTAPGISQDPMVRWLPQQIFTEAEHRPCHLLYYTGITRTAKGILAEIVRNMFLNSGPHLRLLAAMKEHALDMADAIQSGQFHRYGRLVGLTWEQNRSLDPGTDPQAVRAIIDQVKDYTLGLKLPGAGGGGFLYMVAKDPEAALRIRRRLTDHAPNPRARFVEMTLSSTGLQTSRS